MQPMKPNLTPRAASQSLGQLAPPTLVVGVGASAGGLEALEQMFRAMPEHTGMAFVVVQHQSPSFESRMEELLSRQTRLRVCMAEDGAPLHADTIHLAPGGHGRRLRRTSHEGPFARTSS